MSNQVTVLVETYDEPAKTTIRIHSHLLWRDRVVIEIGKEERTVLAKDLIAAIESATNRP